MTYKLPPLSVCISEAKKQFEIMERLGLTQGLTWEKHVDYIKSTYAEMAKMGPVKLQEYIDSKQPRRAAVLLTFDKELEKMHTATEARRRLEKAAEDAKR